MKKFAVFNPADGSYTQVNTIEEAVTMAAQIACAFFMQQTNNAPFSVVEIDENGAETWRTASGEQIDSPAAIKARLEAEMRKIESFRNAGAIPVAMLGQE